MSSSRGGNDGGICAAALVKLLQSIPRWKAERARLAIHLVLVANSISPAELVTAVEVGNGANHHQRFFAPPGQESGTLHDRGALHGNPILMVTPEGNVAVISPSVETFLSKVRLPHDIKAFRFDRAVAHAEMARILMKYLSFEVFKQSFKDLEDDLQLRSHFLLMYATSSLIRHITGTKEAPDVWRKLHRFARSTQGWQWYHRLFHSYRLKQDHIRTSDLELQNWAASDDRSQGLDDFFIKIAESRYCQWDTMSSEERTELEQGLTQLSQSLSEPNERALPVLACLCAARRRLLGADAKFTLIAQLEMGAVHCYAGHYRHAYDAFVCVRKHLGDTNEDGRSDVLEVLRPMADLGMAFITQHQFSEAEDVWRFVYVQRKSLLPMGDTNPATIIAEGNLAMSLTNQGRYEDALPLQEHALSIEVELHGRDTHESLICMNNLARTYHSMGRLADAEKLEIEVLEKRRAICKPTDYVLGACLWNMAMTYDSQGRHSEAETILEETLEVRTAGLGPDHPKTLWAVHYLGVEKAEQGKYSEAESWIKQAFDKQTQVLGTEHQDTRISQVELAHVWLRLGRNQEAFDLAFGAARCMVNPDLIFGTRNTHTLRALRTVDDALVALGRQAEVGEIMSGMGIERVAIEAQGNDFSPTRA